MCPVPLLHLVSLSAIHFSFPISNFLIPFFFVPRIEIEIEIQIQIGIGIGIAEFGGLGELGSEGRKEEQKLKMDSWRRSAENEEEEEEEMEMEQMEQRSELEREEEERSPYLSVQALGACRADERSPLSVPVPSILLPIFGGPPASRDRLLAHLTQLFDPSEIALLVRCLCAPLVSIRVGNINKIGSLLCPIPSRLLLPLLPLVFFVSLAYWHMHCSPT